MVKSLPLLHNQHLFSPIESWYDYKVDEGVSWKKYKRIKKDFFSYSLKKEANFN